MLTVALFSVNCNIHSATGHFYTDSTGNCWLLGGPLYEKTRICVRDWLIGLIELVVNLLRTGILLFSPIEGLGCAHASRFSDMRVFCRTTLQPSSNILFVLFRIGVKGIWNRMKTVRFPLDFFHEDMIKTMLKVKMLGESSQMYLEANLLGICFNSGVRLWSTLWICSVLLLSPLC